MHNRQATYAPLKRLAFASLHQIIHILITEERVNLKHYALPAVCAF